MDSEIMAQCADLIVADAIQDLSARTGKSIDEIRALVLGSHAYEMLYDFNTGLWQEGPDCFAGLIDDVAPAGAFLQESVRTLAP